MSPIDATFDGEVFRPSQAIELKPNTRVKLVFDVVLPSEVDETSFLDVAKSLQLDGPADWSERVDDYLYGKPAGKVNE